MSERTKIVIVGGGFGGAECARTLEKQLRRNKNVDIYLIDKQSRLVFYPLLVEAGMGSLEPRHVTVPIRDLISRTNFTMAEVTGVDFEKQEVNFTFALNGSTDSLRYDHLVLAPGSVINLPPVPGLREQLQKTVFSLKSLDDAIRLRERALSLLETANATQDAEKRKALLNVLVVGGSFNGVEVAGEMNDLMQHEARRYKNISAEDCKVTLVDIADRVLGSIDPRIGAYAYKRMKSHGVEFRLKNSIAKIAPDGVTFKDGTSLPVQTIVWCAGVAPSPLLKSLALGFDKRGYIECEPNLLVKGKTNVWGIGDSAVNPGPDGNAYPATAQHAYAEGRHCAKNIAAVLRGKEPTPCVIKHKGMLTPVGYRKAVGEILGVRFYGMPAWFMWRTFYLWRMPTFGRKVRVAGNWTLNLFQKRRV